MKVKALRYKEEFKEFIHVTEIGGDPMIFTSELPKIQPETTTLEDIKKFYGDLSITWDKVELVEFELIENSNVGADIRNKLTSSLNLLALLELFFQDNVVYADEKRLKLVKYIKKEIEQNKKNIKYISDLL
jgi:hypothetical protein